MKRLSGIRAVTFDAGSTLIEPWPSVGHVYAEAASHGVGRLAPEVLNRRFVNAWRARRQPVHSVAAWADIVDETFAGFVPEPPSRTFFPELYNRFAHANAWRIFDDVIPALMTLAGNDLRLGVISNWDERLRPLMTELGLAKHFEAMIISCETGHAKPAQEIFNAAATTLKLPPDEILHVGFLEFRRDFFTGHIH